jgi:outer membrane biosynthesis protein TonB
VVVSNNSYCQGELTETRFQRDTHRLNSRLSIAFVLSIIVHALIFTQSGHWRLHHSGFSGSTTNRELSILTLSLHLPNDKATIAINNSDQTKPQPEKKQSEENLASTTIEKSELPSPKRDNVAPVASQPPGMIPGPWYFSAQYLDRRPSPLKLIRPVYPVEYFEKQGRVKLVLFIGVTGNVDRYEILESMPAGIFDQSAIEAFTQVPYAPGLISTYAVKSQLLVEVLYEPGLPPTTLMESSPTR